MARLSAQLAISWRHARACGWRLFGYAPFGAFEMTPLDTVAEAIRAARQNYKARARAAIEALPEDVIAKALADAVANNPAFVSFEDGAKLIKKALLAEGA